MDNRKQLYEAPVSEGIEVEMISGILDASFGANRNGYGTASVEDETIQEWE